MHPIFVLLLVTAAPGSLSPAAAGHNTQAMRHYDAGQLAPAVDEFYAAYRSMPDARHDREGRALLLGSMRATLLSLHEQTHEAAPLCRLRSILQEHADALAAAFPDEPDLQELRSVRARHDEATQQLAPFGAHACEPAAPPPVVAPVTRDAPEPPPTPTPAARNTPSPDIIPPRHLRIAGGVTLGLGAALLGVMTYGIFTETSQRARVAAIADKPPDCPLTPGEIDELQSVRGHALFGRRLAVGTGIAAGVTTALGATLLVLARRAARAQRWSATPWWSPTSAGLTLRVQLGSTRHSARGVP